MNRITKWLPPSIVEPPEELQSCLREGRSDSLEAIDLKWADDAYKLYWAGVRDQKARHKSELDNSYARGVLHACAGFVVLLSAMAVWRLL